MTLDNDSFLMHFNVEKPPGMNQFLAPDIQHPEDLLIDKTELMMGFHLKNVIWKGMNEVNIEYFSKLDLENQSAPASLIKYKVADLQMSGLNPFATADPMTVHISPAFAVEFYVLISLIKVQQSTKEVYNLLGFECEVWLWIALSVAILSTMSTLIRTHLVLMPPKQIGICRSFVEHILFFNAFLLANS